MLQLTLDLNSSAEILGIEPKNFLTFLEQEKMGGIIRLKDNWRISIFTLAQILSTTPQILLEIIEDYHLGQLMEEVTHDETFDEQAGWQVYQTYLAEEKA